MILIRTDAEEIKIGFDAVSRRDSVGKIALSDEASTAFNGGRGGGSREEESGEDEGAVGPTGQRVRGSARTRADAQARVGREAGLAWETGDALRRCGPIGFLRFSLGFLFYKIAEIPNGNRN